MDCALIEYPPPKNSTAAKDIITYVNEREIVDLKDKAKYRVVVGVISFFFIVSIIALAFFLFKILKVRKSLNEENHIRRTLEINIKNRKQFIEESEKKL